MRFLLDQGLPRSATGNLRDRGFDAVHVGEIGLETASDELILERSRQENRVAVTLDADFHALLALSGAATPSVIRFRIEGLRGPELVALLMTVLDKCTEDLQAGAVVTVQEQRIRLRRLPMGGAE
ncbi:MAG: DUF5615 family PIN-like protein [Thermoanaerobaculia bacterium]|nr:DUF5615 family PIN-like protein [Thermoanaerobaculia bacterium]